ncbi:MAG: hypothetical protein A3D67_00185 [Candidatus Lloydbacteria bacterium RIFCSPHIGHO2_02_FULL_51_22]|uniref:Uncharacterized protein n=1 Tax=Candidatus Lloydbacteria bacterium RIFCSPHIGHO2_02_FULL_51_22 TaxID=1798663 RepID=A0A1G2DD53_9BACT|nr:MAG: hypothetical protein A3D67_00185 [Candidatus Lloydbacteria bacterium RIFCSPHIGHO2_02_FULL_51_22]
MKRKKQFIANLLAVMCLLVAPILAFAITAVPATTGTGGVILGKIIDLMLLVIPLVFGLAFLVFLWGIYKYIRAAEEGDKAEGRNTIIYGIIGLFVMVAVWGLVKVIGTTFNIGLSTGSGTLPGFPTQ